jgi:hypothetical protein
MTRIVLAAVASLALVVPALSAESTTLAVGVEHLVRTNSPGGECSQFLEANRSTTTVCEDGAGRAIVNSAAGCIAAQGTGQCIIGAPPDHTHAFASVTCPGPKGHIFDMDSTHGGCVTSRDPDGEVTGAKCYGASWQVVSEMTCACNGGQGCCLSETSAEGSCRNERSAAR